MNSCTACTQAEYPGNRVPIAPCAWCPSTHQCIEKTSAAPCPATPPGGIAENSGDGDKLSDLVCLKYAIRLEQLSVGILICDMLFALLLQARLAQFESCCSVLVEGFSPAKMCPRLFSNMFRSLVSLEILVFHESMTNLVERY